MVEALGWLMEGGNGEAPVVISVTEFGTALVRDPNMVGPTWMVAGDSGDVFAQMATSEYEKVGFTLAVRPLRVTLEADPWPEAGNNQDLIESYMQPLLDELVAAIGYRLPKIFRA